MKMISNRLKISKTLILKSNYSILEAIQILKKFNPLKFNESIEAHINLNINPKNINQQVRTTISLPNGLGKQVKIAVLIDDNLFNTTLKMGADIVGCNDLIENIINGIINFDILLTTPQLMPKLAKLGKILGPKGLMPSSKAGTITTNMLETITEFKKGKFEYRADKTGIVHLSFGKISFSESQIIENLLTVYSSIEKNKPVGLKGRYIKSFFICNTMSPSLKLDLTSFKTI
jgi:large subunit ribosomal protein L1